MTIATPPDLDSTIEFVITRKRQIKQLEDDINQALDALCQAVDNGDLDPTFEHDDTKFDLRPGRVTYAYPPAVTELSLKLKDAQAAAVADGTATPKHGEPFWVVKLPKP